MTQDKRNRKQAMNDRLAALNRDITAAEDLLATLYANRAGRTEWNADGQPGRGWCCRCGKVAVRPADGFDTCPACVATC
jgi:hypothetical protein